MWEKTYPLHIKSGSLRKGEEHSGNHILHPTAEFAIRSRPFCQKPAFFHTEELKITFSDWFQVHFSAHVSLISVIDSALLPNELVIL